MEVDHLLQIHAVDVVSTEDGDDIEVAVFYQVDVLVNSVCRSLVPAVSCALLCGNGEYEMITQNGTESPAFLQVFG